MSIRATSILRRHRESLAGSLRRHVLRSDALARQWLASWSTSLGGSSGALALGFLFCALWLLLLIPLLHGPGRISIDHFIRRRFS